MKKKNQAVGRTEATVGTVVLLVLTACPPAFAQCPDGTPPPCPGQRLTVRRAVIAVLPFVNRSRGTADAYVAGRVLGTLLPDERALALDPASAVAWAGRGTVLCHRDCTRRWSWRLPATAPGPTWFWIRHSRGSRSMVPPRGPIRTRQRSSPSGAR